MVRLQMFDLRRALYGAGDYVLAPSFHRHGVNYDAWTQMSKERKDAIFQCFLSDGGKSRHRHAEKGNRLVKSADGHMAVLPTAEIARKPGQKKRARAMRTR